MKSHQNNSDSSMGELVPQAKDQNSTCEPSIRKQLQYQAIKSENTSTDCSSPNLESSDHVKEATEIKTEENNADTNSLTVALTLSLLKEKLNILDKLYQLKTLQLAKLKTLQNGSAEALTSLPQSSQLEKQLLSNQAFPEISSSINNETPANFNYAGMKNFEDYRGIVAEPESQYIQFQIQQGEQDLIQLDNDLLLAGQNIHSSCAVVDYNILERNSSELDQRFVVDDSQSNVEDYFNLMTATKKKIPEVEFNSCLPFFDKP